METNITNQDNVVAESFFLKQGYFNVNVLNLSDTQDKNLNSYIIEQISKHYGEKPHEIVSITEEERSTNYIKNLRLVKNCLVINEDKTESVFAFDVTGCISS